MSDFEETIKHSHELAVSMKTDEDGDGEFIPVLVLGFEGGTFPCMMAGLNSGDLLQGAKTAIKHIKTNVIPEVEKTEGTKIGKMLWMSISADTYVQTMEKLHEDETIDEAKVRRHKGYLGDAFKAGAPDVFEAIVTTGCAPGQTMMITHIYRETATDGWEWEDPKYSVGSDTDPRWSFESMDAS